jgi:hypothetical protein
MSKLERQLRELAETTNAKAARMPTAEARALRAASLEQARALVERNSGPSLRLVNRREMLPPGMAGRRRSGLRW